MKIKDIRIPEPAVPYTNKAAFFLVLLCGLTTYLSLNKMSLGTEYLIIGGLLAAYYHRTSWKICVPSFAASCFAILSLMIVGRFGERGFNAPIGNALKFVQIFFVIAVASAIMRQGNRGKAIFMQAAMAVLMISCLISVYCTLFIDEYAIRYYLERGFWQAFDFNQIYAIPLIMPAAVYFTLERWKESGPATKITMPILIVLLMVTVYKSLYTFAMLLTLLMAVLAVMLWLKNHHPKILLWICAAVILIYIVCLIFRQPVSDFLFDLTEDMNWLVKARIRSVVDMLLGTEHENWYAPDRRDELADYSWKSFLANPVFGVGYKGYGYEVIGGHQEWVDMLGVWGVVGMILFVGMMAYSFWCVFSNAKTSMDKNCMVLSASAFVVLGFLNPCLAVPQLMAVFVIAPNMSALSAELFKTAKLFNLKKK